MSYPILTGRIAVYGINGTVTLTGTGILGSTNLLHQSLAYKRSTQKADLKDGNGKLITRAYHGPEARLTVKFVPYDPTDPGNLATLKSKIFLPDPGSLVTIASSESPDMDGTWNFSGEGSIDPNQEGFLEVTLELERVGESANAPASLDVTP